MKEQGFERWLSPSDRDRSQVADPEADKPTLVQSPAHLLENERAPRTLPRYQPDSALADFESDLDRSAARDAGAYAEPEVAFDDAWSPDPRSDEPSYIGQLIDNRYLVEALIARGGMGIVYRCRHQLIDRKFAVKIIRSTMAHLPDAPRRFLIEAKAASSIGNEHIVDVVDYGTLADGSAYLVMELLEGEPLSDIIARHEPLPLARISAIASQVCEGLHAAHEAGIIHRDLKPENIFLAQRKSGDFVKILDFGIAKMLSAGESLTKRGLIVGTPHYMSPEQAAGAAVDARGDIYALGVILFELATGQVPFDATHYMAVLAKHLSEPPPPFDSLRSSAKLPADFEAIVQRCLAKRPDQRFQTMLEVMEATDRLTRRLRAPSPLDVPEQPALPEIVPPAVPALHGALAAREPPVDSSRGSGNSLPAAADRSVVAPPRSRGLSLVLSALALAALGISLWRMQGPLPLHGAGTPRAAANGLERLPEASAMPTARTLAAPPVPAAAVPLAAPQPTTASRPLSPPAAAPGSSSPANDGAERTTESPAPAADPAATGGPPGIAPPVAGAAPLTVVELAPGKSVEIEARTRLSLRLTKDAEANRAAVPSGAAPAARKSSNVPRPPPPKPERSSDSREPSGLMNPWPTPAIGPANPN